MPVDWAPAATALFARSSTCSRLSVDKPMITSRLLDVSTTSWGVMNSLKNGSTCSMTEVSSLMIMRVAFSSVVAGSNEKPSLVKNSVVLAKSFTGKLTNVIIGIVNSLLYSSDHQ